MHKKLVLFLLISFSALSAMEQQQQQLPVVRSVPMLKELVIKKILQNPELYIGAFEDAPAEFSTMIRNCWVDYNQRSIIDILKIAPKMVQFDRHNSYVSSVVFNRTKDKILTPSPYYSVQLWEWKLNGACLATFQHNNEVLSAIFNKAEDKILTASIDYTAKLWDLHGTCLATFQHNSWVNKAIFNKAGDKILTASSDCTAKLWDLHGNCLATFQDHIRGVNSALFNNVEDKILTASDDGTAKLWDLHGTCLATFQHRDTVHTAVFKTEDNILTISSDGTAKLWDISALNAVKQTITALSADQILLLAAIDHARKNDQQLKLDDEEKVVWQRLQQTSPTIASAVRPYVQVSDDNDNDNSLCVIM